MMRTLILLGIALAVPAHAGDQHRPAPPARAAAPWMTGAQLLRKLETPGEAEEAVTYLKGVVDATADREWCFSQTKPDSAQLQPTLTDRLRALSPTQARRNAAALAVEAWQARWPCSSTECCHD